MAPALRFEDWPLRLDAFLSAARDRPFSWGDNDCALFVADCIGALTGVDPAADLRGRYVDQDSAAAVIGAGGLSRLVERIASAHGFQSIQPTFAGRGDVVMFTTPEYGVTLGICIGAYIAAPGADGMILFKRSRIERAWRVP